MPLAAVIATLPIHRPYAGMAWVVTVDFWRGLRLYPQDQTGAVTADYGSMTLLDDISGTPAESLQYGIEAANVRGVFVNGTGVSAFVTDGSGKVGPINYVSDATIDTQAKATNYATNVLAGYAVPIRGQLRRESWLPTLDIHPGSSLFLTDARLGIVNVGRIITNLSKTFEGGKLETWVVAFGGNPPSVSTLIRKLTAQPRS